MDKKTCEWTEEDEDCGNWETECGGMFTFNDGGPIENDALFCMYCGGEIAIGDAKDKDNG